MNTNNCPKCNNPFTPGAIFCQSCGFNLEKEFAHSLQCPTCGKVFAKGAGYCDMDGTALVSPEKAIPRCVNCGAEYDYETKYCPKDGGKVMAGGAGSNENAGNNRYAAAGYNTAKTYPKAPLGDRFIALLLDGLISLGLSIPSMVLVFMGIKKMGRYSYGDNETEAAVLIVFGALFFALPLIYGLIKDGIGEGQSYGKKAAGLMVVNLDNNTPCTKGKSAIRNLVKMVLGAIPYVGWLVEPIVTLADSKGRRAGDWAANTQVVEVIRFKQLL